jgi:hypothetical protein
LFCFALSSHTATFSRHGSSLEPSERLDHKVLSSFDIGSWMGRIWVPKLNRTISRCHCSTVKTRPSQSMLLELPIRRQAPFLWVLRTGPLVTSELMIRKPCLVHDFWAPTTTSSDRRSQPRKHTTARVQNPSTKLALCLLRPGIMCSIQTWARPTAVSQHSTK